MYWSIPFCRARKWSLARALNSWSASRSLVEMRGQAKDVNAAPNIAGAMLSAYAFRHQAAHAFRNAPPGSKMPERRVN
jgi:hypothetical protein